MAYIRKYLELLGLSGVVIAADQWTKFQVRNQLELGQVWEPIEAISSFFRIVHWNNTGAAFGILPSAGLFFTVIAVGVTAAILYYYPRIPAGQLPLRIALGLQLGGAIGNLTDRLTQGPVTDFIAVGRLPVFNLADASISLGVGVLVIAMWFEERRGETSEPEEVPEPSPPLVNPGEDRTAE